MSLDIYLITEKCPHCGRSGEGYSANITHNLCDMADALGIYEFLWHPERAGIKTAGQLIAPLKQAICLMKDAPAKYKAFDASNGWGTYKDFLPWLERLLEACEQSPDAGVEASR